MFGWFKKDSPKMEPDDYSLNDKSWYYENKNKDIDKKYEEIYKKALKASSDVIKKKDIGYRTSDMWTTITTPNIGSGAINVTPNTSVSIDLPLVVNGRNVMGEIDLLKDALLILSRDLKLEEKYPELKEAYDNYMEIKRGLGIAEKLYSTGKDNV
jgi:hypothetical protein